MTPSFAQLLTSYLAPRPISTAIERDEDKGCPSEETLEIILAKFSTVPQCNADVRAKLDFGPSTIIKGTRELRKRGLIVKSGLRRSNTDYWVLAEWQEPLALGA